MSKKGLLICILWLTGGTLLHGQDLHYSQFMSSPVYLNPAATGVFKGTLRLALNGKNQWQSVTKPYQTLSLAVDMCPVQRRYRRDAFGMGLVLHTDVAGDSKFSTTTPALTFSYIRQMDRQSRHTLSLGLHTGWVFRSVNYSALTYGNQYNGFYYDPDLPDEEQYSLSNYSYFDIGAGAQWHFQFTRERNAYAGLAVYHFLHPHQSFMDNREIRLDMKWNAYAGAQIDVGPAVDVLPQFLFMKQGQYREFMLGAIAKYIQNRYSKTLYTAFNAGLFYRNSDAMVFMAGVDYRHFTLGISYDMNISKLKPASYYRGGLEFSLVYIYNNSKQKRRKEIPCPIF